MTKKQLEQENAAQRAEIDALKKQVAGLVDVLSKMPTVQPFFPQPIPIVIQPAPPAPGTAWPQITPFWFGDPPNLQPLPGTVTQPQFLPPYMPSWTVVN
jgi:hypothetical protein